MIVCKYKFDSSIYDNLIPEFNSGYNGYTITDEIDGNIVIRTIECDTLPTLMRFGTEAWNSEITNDVLSLKEIIDINVNNLSDMSYMFCNCHNLNKVKNLNVTSVTTSLQLMFYQCKMLIQVDSLNWDTSNVKNMQGVFQGCQSLINLDTSNWDTNNVIDMNSVFRNCNSLPLLNLSNFNIDNVTKIGYMFDGCSSLITLDLSNWNTDKVTDKRNIFTYCPNLQYIRCNNVSTINTLASLLYDRTSSTQGKIIASSSTDVDTTTLSSLNWSIDTSSGTKIAEYVYDKSIYNYLVPEFNEGYNGYFVNDKIEDESKPNIVTRELVGYGGLPTLMRFGQAYVDGEVQQDYTKCLLEILDMNTSELTSCHSMFRYCTNLTSISCNWNTSKVTNMYYMFYNCNKLTQLDVSNFNTSKVTDMQSMFRNCYKLTQLDVSNFDTSYLTSMYCMFYRCKNLTQLDVSNFNTSKVTDMSYMFSDCSKLTQLDLSNFNTSNTVTMYAMFYGCYELTQLDVSNWNTSKVNNMQSMFRDCNKLTQLDVSNFNTSKVENMRYMFTNCTNLTQLDVSNFDTSNANNMQGMFDNTSKLVNIGMIYCNENTVLKIKEVITNGNVNIWIDENIILPNNTNYVTFKHFKECNKTLYLNSPLLEGDTIEEIEGKTYHVKRYEKIVLDGNENLVNFEEKENTCFVNIIYSPLGKQQGNLICDKFVIGEAYDNDIECIDLHTLNGNLHFNIAKSKLNKISVQGILEYLQQNPVTIVYELAEPIYELVSDDSLLLDSYSGGNLSLDTNIALDKISFTSYEEELTYLYSNTLYTVQFYANDDGIGNVMLGGSLLENKEIVRGLNNIHITTPNVLSNNKLNISTTSGNIYISNVVVTNTGMEFNYFEGMKSTFEDMYIDDIDNKYYGKYKVECKIVGKNKFDKTDFTLYKLWREDGTIGHESAQNGASKLLPVTPNTKYKCSNNEGWNQVLYFDKNKKYIGSAGSGVTNIITPSNCYYIGVNLRITALDIFQIEEGTIATEYVPYREYNTSIYLNSPLLQGDKIMVKDNKLCHYHKMGIRKYQEGDLDNHITDLINTIYLLTEPYYEDITPIQSSFVMPTVLEGDMEILTNLPIKSNITYMTNITSAVMLERQLDEIDSGTNSLSDILDGEINE